MFEETISGLELIDNFTISSIENPVIQEKAKYKDKYPKFLGVKNTYLPLIHPTFSQNILFTGGIGSGKTNGISILLDQTIGKMYTNDIMIIFDSKGDYSSQFGRLKTGGFEIQHLSNDSGSTVIWNLFKEAVFDLPNDATKREINDALLELSSILFQPMIERDTNNPFFTLAAKNIFYGILRVLCEKYYLKTRNSNSISNRMIYEYSQKPVDEIIKDFTSPACYSDLNQLVDYLGRIDSKGEFRFNDQGASVLATLRNTLLELFKGNFVKDGSFSIRDFITKPGKKLLFIEYDIRYGYVLAPMYKTLIDLAIKEALGRKKGVRNVFFVIDEFRLLPKLEYMDAGVNFGRSLGAKFIVGIQNILQIDDVYGKALSRSILSGFLTTVNFRTTDFETREYIKSLFGKRIYIYDNMSLSGGRSREHADVINDSDILKLKTGEAIISLPVLSKNPIRFQFLNYENYPSSLKIK